MPTISNNREYSTSKNIKIYLIQMMNDTYSDSWTIGKRSGDLPAELTDSGATVHPVYAFNRMPNLQEIPDLAEGESNSNADTIEITTLQDSYHEFADGLKNHDDAENDNALAFTFLYDEQCYAGTKLAINIQKKTDSQFEDGTQPTDIVKDNRYVAIVLPDDSYFIAKYKNMNTTFSGVGTNASLTYQMNITLNGTFEWKRHWSRLPYANLAGELIMNENANENIKYIIYTNDAWANEAYSI